MQLTATVPIDITDAAMTAAVHAAMSAAPADQLQDRWANEMRNALAAIPDRSERDRVARLAAEPAPGVVWVNPAEMVTLAIARDRVAGTQPGRLEVQGLVNSFLPDANRTALLQSEMRTFWSDPPATIRALSAGEQTLLRNLHARSISSNHSWSGSFEGIDGTNPELRGRFAEREMSGLKLHVSTRGTLETIQMLARLLPVLPSGTGFKIANDTQLRQPATMSGLRAADGNMRARSEQQRKGITVYLPPELTVEQYSELLSAITVRRHTDIILDEQEITPGVFMRCEHRIRFPEGVSFDQYFGLYRPAANQVWNADLQAHAVLNARPELGASFKKLFTERDTDQGVVFEPRALLIAAALGLDDLDRPPEMHDAFRALMGSRRATGGFHHGNFIVHDLSSRDLLQLGVELAGLQVLAARGVTLPSDGPDVLSALESVTADRDGQMSPARSKLLAAFAQYPELAEYTGAFAELSPEEQQRIRSGVAQVQPSPGTAATVHATPPPIPATTPVLPPRPTMPRSPVPQQPPAAIPAPTPLTDGLASPLPAVPPGRDAAIAAVAMHAGQFAATADEVMRRLDKTDAYLQHMRATRGPELEDTRAYIPNLRQNLQFALAVGEWQTYLDPANTALMTRTLDQLQVVHAFAHDMAPAELPQLRLGIAIASARLGQDARALDAFRMLRTNDWQSLAPADRAAGLFHQGRALRMAGDPDAALESIDRAIAEYAQLGQAGVLGKAYAEVQRFGLLSAPSMTDHRAARDALRVIEQAALRPENATAYTQALTGDLSVARSGVQAVARALIPTAGA